MPPNMTEGSPASKDWALAEACWNDDARRAGALLEQGADPNAEFPSSEVGGFGNGRETALGLALRCDSFDVAKLLIEHGADVHGNGDLHCFGPLHNAAASLDERGTELAGMLLERGADPNARALCKTPLHVVRLASMAELLIGHGADVNAMNDAWAEGSPLHMAAQSGNTEVARVLLRHGADVNARDRDGHTPLFWARDYGYAETAELLEHAGGKV